MLTLLFAQTVFAAQSWLFEAKCGDLTSISGGPATLPYTNIEVLYNGIHHNLKMWDTVNNVSRNQIVVVESARDYVAIFSPTEKWTIQQTPLGMRLEVNGFYTDCTPAGGRPIQDPFTGKRYDPDSLWDTIRDSARGGGGKCGSELAEL